MKVGILTQPLGLNFGGVLQNYALQHVLKQLGHEPITFRVGRRSIIQYVLSSIKAFLLKQKKPESQYSIDSRRIGIESFISRYINTTQEQIWYSCSMLKLYKIEALVVGSDQTWRPAYNWKIEDLFLDFAKELNVKRISYAASFGTEKWEFSVSETYKCKELIKLFDAVSVRELSGVSLCKQYLDREDVAVVLDPTLLLTKNDYEKHLDIPSTKTSILFSYILDNNKEKQGIIDILKNKLNLELKSSGVNNNISASDTIERWLSNIYNSQLILTDSFHGTVFSILFHKNFLVINNEKRGASRIDNLLSIVGLESRLINTAENALTVLENNINWVEVDIKLQKARETSIEFLKNAFCKSQLS